MPFPYCMYFIDLMLIMWYLIISIREREILSKLRKFGRHRLFQHYMMLLHNRRYFFAFFRRAKASAKRARCARHIFGDSLVLQTI